MFDVLRAYLFVNIVNKSPQSAQQMKSHMPAAYVIQYDFSGIQATIERQ
jgi:hypothetical protein